MDIKTFLQINMSTSVSERSINMLQWGLIQSWFTLGIARSPFRHLSHTEVSEDAFPELKLKSWGQYIKTSLVLTLAGPFSKKVGAEVSQSPKKSAISFSKRLAEVISKWIMLVLYKYMRTEIAEDFQLTDSFISIRVRLDEDREKKAMSDQDIESIRQQMPAMWDHLVFLLILCLQKYLEASDLVSGVVLIVVSFCSVSSGEHLPSHVDQFATPTGDKFCRYG